MLVNVKSCVGVVEPTSTEPKSITAGAIDSTGGGNVVVTTTVVVVCAGRAVVGVGRGVVCVGGTVGGTVGGAVGGGLALAAPRNCVETAIPSPETLTWPALFPAAVGRYSNVIAHDCPGSSTTPLHPSPVTENGAAGGATAPNGTTTVDVFVTTAFPGLLVAPMAMVPKFTSGVVDNPGGRSRR